MGKTIQEMMDETLAENSRNKASYCPWGLEKVTTDAATQTVEEVPKNKCSICDKTFADSYKRDRHIREVHNSEEGRIKCKDCYKTFLRQEALRRHRTFTHDGITSPFKCDICDKAYSELGTLNRHKRTVHGGERNFKCTDCPAKYAQMQDLEKHVQSGNHYRDAICPYCEERMVFKSKSAWRKHYIKDPPTKSGKETCVTKLNEKRQQDHARKKKEQGDKQN